MEKEFTILERMGNMFNKETAFNAQVQIKCEGVICEELLRKAVNKIQKERLYLNCYVDQISSTNGKFVTFDSDVEIPIEINKNGFDNWEEAAEKDLNTAFRDIDKPMMKINIFTKNEKSIFIVTVSHLISDGLSIFNMIIELFSAYNDLLNDKDISILDMKGAGAIELKDFPKMDNDFSVFEYPKEGLAVSSGSLKYAERKNKFIEYKLDRNIFENFIAFCKKNNCNINSCLSTIGGITLGKIIKEKVPDVKNEKLKIDILTSMDLRRRVEADISPEHMGICSMFAKTGQILVGEDNDIVQATKGAHESLKNFFSKDGEFKLMQYIMSQFSLEFKDFMEVMQFRDPYINISYLNNLKINNKETDKLKIIDFSGTPTTVYSQGNKWGVCMTITNLNEDLNICLAYTDGYWDKELAENYLNAFSAELEKAVK